MTESTHPPAEDASVAQLLTALSEQTSRLVRDELALAKVEMTDKAKHAGLAAGLFGAAGVLGLFALGVFVATAILALALVLPAWLSALIVGTAIVAAAGVVALIGRKQVSQATPVQPQTSIANVKQDLETVKEARQ